MLMPRLRSTTRRSAVAVTAAGMLLAAAPAANAADGGAGSPVSFSGHCTVKGTETLSGPVLLPTANIGFTGTGTCVGSLDGGASATHALTAALSSDDIALSTFGPAAFLRLDFDNGQSIYTHVQELGPVINVYTDGSPQGQAIGAISTVLGGPATLTFSTLSTLTGTSLT